MSLARALVLFAAALLAGMINSIAGGGSLVSFPALVWAGLDPVVANATNTVAYAPGGFTAALALRRELRGLGAWMLLLGPPSLAGGALGAWLLLVTPGHVFARLAPYLILFATALFALQGTIVRAAPPASPGASAGMPRDGSLPGARAIALAGGFQLVIAVYGGYFGAGLGIVMLAGLGLLGLSDIRRMLALRNFAGATVNAVAAVYFVARGCVSWPETAVMVVGQVAGGWAGAALALRVDPALVRRAVVVVGLAMAASLFLGRR